MEDALARARNSGKGAVSQPDQRESREAAKARPIGLLLRGFA